VRDTPKPVTISIEGEKRISGLLQTPSNAIACYVMAHGAGAGMNHPFMAGMAEGLAQRGFATLRYQFPYMEVGSKRPDSPKVAQKAVRAAVAEASRLVPKLPLFAGGKSFGGRMTSQAQAASPLPGVQGLIFLGFPLHAAGKPSDERAAHLSQVQIPMLFLQGTRDQLADIDLMQRVVKRLGTLASMKTLEGADHSFHVLARSGRTDLEVKAEILDATAMWMEKVLRSESSRERVTSI
jgi:predicted alpha/beta-hydrolase family hydrolase